MKKHQIIAERVRQNKEIADGKHNSRDVEMEISAEHVKLWEEVFEKLRLTMDA